MEENLKIAVTGGRPQGILYFANGQELGPIEDIQIAALEPAEEEVRIMGFDLAQCGDFTSLFTPRFPRVSRKRFIHNLIKAGCPKKQAKEIAWRVQKDRKQSYGFANVLAAFAGWQNVR